MGINEYRNQFKEPVFVAERKLKRLFPGRGVSSRIKTEDSIIEKLQRRKISLDEMTDIGGVRVIFPDLQSLTSGIDKIRNNFQVIQEENYIDKPKQGYRSYHFLIEVNGLPIELQFKTIRMLEWSEFGHTHFPVYKSESELKQLYGKNYKKLTKYYYKMSEHYALSDVGKQLKRPHVPTLWKTVGLPMFAHNPVGNCPVCGAENEIVYNEFNCTKCGESLKVRII